MTESRRLWTLTHAHAPDTHANIRRVVATFDGEPASVADVIRGLQRDADLRTLLSDCLAQLPFAAFKWETPAVTAASVDRPFEFVALDAPGLARPADPSAFAEHFDGPGAVATFPNLGADAVLVVPRPQGEDCAYAHLAEFVRQAPEAQRHALWQATGDALAARLGQRPVWLSTAGEGVSWLHLRLDDRPKYYGHDPYRLAW